MIDIKAVPMIPAQTFSMWVFVLLMVFLIVLFGIFGWFMYWSQHTTFEIGGGKLTINGGLYSANYDKTQLQLDIARIIDLSQDDAMRPRVRTNGIGFPGYRSGWFRLKNGEKALVFVTDEKKTVLIPTNQGHSLLLSVSDGETFLQQLRAQ